MKRIGILLLLLSGIASASPVIDSAVVSGTLLTITGTGFIETLAVTFNGKRIPITSSSATQIGASLSSVPSPGTYRLTVKAGTASTSGYVSVSAAPFIVNQIALTAETMPISQTTIATPTATALYRLSGYLDCGDTGNGGWSLQFFWTDLNGSRESNSQSCAGNSDEVAWNFVVSEVADASLSYAAFGSGGSYDLFMTVEQLQ